MTTSKADTFESIRTPDGFAQAVRKAKPLEFAEMVADLREAERKKLSKCAQDLFREVRKKERENFGWSSHAGQMSRLALLAAGPKSAACRLMDFDLTPIELTRVGFWRPDRDYQKAAIQILVDRRPEWADQWLDCQVDDGRFRISWGSVRRLICEGVCRKPESEAYVRLVGMCGLGADFDRDPDVLEDAWKLFEFPTDVWPRVPKSKELDYDQWRASRGRTWPQIFYHLACQGRIDRGRLLDATLDALWRDFTNPARAGLMRFHDILAPTESEFIQRQTGYVELLRNPAPSVVSFALRVLKSHARVDALNAEAVLDGLPAAFDIRAKMQPKAALSLARSIARRRPQSQSAAAVVATHALEHPEPDVQLEAIKLLKQWAEAAPRDRLRDARELVSPAVRPQLDDLLGETSTTSADPGEPEAMDDTAFHACLAELRERVQRLPPDIAGPWKLEETFAAVEAGRLPPPADIDAAPAVLHQLEPVEPIADVDELIDAVSHAVERIDSPMEIDRILDGIARLGLDRPADFEARREPLRQQILTGDTFDISPLVELVTEWLQLEKKPTRDRVDDAAGPPDWPGAGAAQAAVDSVLSFVKLARAAGESLGAQRPSPRRSHLYVSMLEHHATLVRRRLRAGRTGPLLSMPTHEHGWIDPRVFVERLKEAWRLGLPLDDGDFEAGLLRLAPDSREDAIAQASALPEPAGRIVRYALGADEQPTQADKAWKAQWLAAGRTRSPSRRLDESEVLGLPASPNAVTPAQYRIHLDRVPEDGHMSVYYHNAWRDTPLVEVTPEPPKRTTRSEYPVLLLSRRAPRTVADLAWSFPAVEWAEAWLASLWPANPEPFLVPALPSMAIRLDSPASSFEPVAALLTPLLRPERAWSPTAIHALWMALFSRDGDARAVAVDALAEGLLDGRAHPEPLAEVLVEMAAQPWAKLNRLVDGLRQAMHVSRWTAIVLSCTLDRLIASWDKPPRDAHHVLEVQLELLTSVGGRPGDAARAKLERVGGSGKTARLAKQLLKLADEGAAVADRAALLEALELRLSRASRMIHAAAESGSGSTGP